MGNAAYSESEYVSLVISSFSFLLTSFGLFSISRNQKLSMNITFKFISMILFSELINNLAQLSVGLYPIIGDVYEKDVERMRVCYVQIFLNIFSNFLTLFSTLFMSLQLYLKAKNKNDDFENKSKAQIFQGCCFYISLLISYIFYVIYLDKYQNNIFEDVYIILSCWMSVTMEKPFWIINCILLVAIILHEICFL